MGSLSRAPHRCTAPLLIAALAGCAGSRTVEEPEEARLQPGIHELELEGQRYTLSVPDAAGPRPLVLALHYGGPVSPWYGRGVLETLVLPGLGALDAFVAAPDCPGRGWADPVSEAAVLALLEHLEAELPLSGQRIVTGFSMGGIGSWYLAAAQPGRFLAALPVAGRPDPAWVPRIGIPVYAINSRVDEVIPIGPAEAAVAALRARGAPVEFAVVADLAHLQTARFAPYLEAAVPWIQAQLDQ